LLRGVPTPRDITRTFLTLTLLGAGLAATMASLAQSPDQAAPTPPLSAADAQAELRRRIDAREYEQAVAEARRLVEAASQRPEAGEDLQVAYMNLAVAQYLAGDYVGAEASYQRVIELIEASGRATNPRLARAQAGLATTYYAGKRYDLAVQHFDRAVALSRRSEGLFNEAQLPLLDKYADALTEVGRFQDALKVQRYALRIVERKHGAASLRYAAQLESLGRWYTRIREYESSRAVLRSAIEVAEDAKGENAPELIGPLTALSENDRRQLLDPQLQDLATADDQRRAIFHEPMAPIGPSLSSSTIASEGQKALERAVAIASGRPDANPAQLAGLRAQLGDWYQSRQQFDKALPIYQQAWSTAAGQTVDGKALTEQLFGRPVLLHYVPPDSWDRYFGRPAGEATVRNVAVEVTVTAQGRVTEPKVVADGGDPKLGAQTARAAQSARYRPRFEKGLPVDTTGVRIDQPFYVLVEQEPEPAATKPAG
jgi:tetratricopeptide (TPR) repeat protein